MHVLAFPNWSAWLERPNSLPVRVKVPFFNLFDYLAISLT